MRHFISIYFLLVFGVALSFSACTQGDGFEEPVVNDSISNLIIRLNQSSSFIPSLYSAAEDEAKENEIRSVSVYVFWGNTLRKIEHFESLSSDSKQVKVPIPFSDEELSAFVVANVKIKDPASKSELLQMMSEVEIGPDGIPPAGLPMASGELSFVPGLTPLIDASLQRCHSAIYVETPNGKNNYYDIYLYGEQRLRGPLIVGNTTLAAEDTNNDMLLKSYPLTATSERELVAYFYPTDSEYGFTILIRLAGSLNMLRTVYIDKDKAKMRNKKYLLRINGSLTKSHLQEGTDASPQVELIVL